MLDSRYSTTLEGIPMAPERSMPAPEPDPAAESTTAELTERDLEKVSGGYNPKEMTVDKAKWELSEYDANKSELKSR